MIKTNNISKKFDSFQALKDVSCTISSGCIYGMVGSNGAGKSTFLRLLAGIYKPNSGTILYDGEPVYDNPAVKSKLCYVPDDLYFLPGANMYRMADFYSSIYPAFDKKRFDELAKEFGLDPKKSITNFSKGMKRQVAIILALCTHASYLFFDETFDGLDPIIRNFVKSLICKEVYDSNTTVIVTSHSLRELEDICDQLSLLHKGGLILESDIENLKTSQFKVQLAMDFDFSKELFNQLEVFSYHQQGHVASMIVKGDREHTMNILNDLKPILLEILPLTLEEVFVYELEALGYVLNDNDI